MGVDVPVAACTPLYSIANNGKVVKIDSRSKECEELLDENANVASCNCGKSSDYGKHLVIEYATPAGEKYYASYFHMKEIVVTADQPPINCGDVIGFADSTGCSTGNHLHFQIDREKQSNGKVISHPASCGKAKTPLDPNYMAGKDCVQAKTINPITSLVDFDGDGVTPLLGDCDDTNPAVQFAVCGNAIPEGASCGEQCDDGNIADSDCCSSTCQAEDLGTQACGVGACERTIARCAAGAPQACVPGTAGNEGPTGNSSCSNAIDDDCDGFTDSADPECVPAGPQVLVSGLNFPEALALDGTQVYFGEHTGVVSRISIGGGSVTALGTVPNFVVGLAVDGTSVYVSSTPWSGGTGSVHQLPKTGGTSSVLTYSNQPDDIAVDATHVYWSENNGGTPSGIHTSRKPVAGGDVEPLTSATLQGVMAIDDTHVYYRYDFTGAFSYPVVAKIPKGGGVSVSLASPTTRPDGMALSETTVFWTEPISGQIRSVPKSGGTSTTILSGLNQPYRVAVDSSRIYWIERGFGGAGALRSAALDGTDIVTIADTLDGPYDLALDATSVYWVEYGLTATSGALKKAPK